MDRWILLALSLFFATRGICAGHLDVLPQETTVPQCSTLEVLWDQPSPIHLHVQPNLLINVTNLFDLGIQNGTFTTYQVALPVGQNFSFAYNTLANQFLVFQSSMMTVGPGTAECLSNGNPSSSASSSSSSTSSSSTSTSSATAPVSTSLTAVLSPSAVPDTNSHSGSGISSGAVGGIVVGAVAVILAALGGFCFSKRRYKQKLAALEGSQHDSVTPRFLDQESGRGQAVTMISPYRTESVTSPYDPSIMPSTVRSPFAMGSHTLPEPSLVSPPTTRKGSSSTSVTQPPAAPRILHTDGGVRVEPEELPPVYRNYDD